MKTLSCRLTIGAVALSLLGSWAQASTGLTPYAMNFSGYLERNAVPVTGTYEMLFSLVINSTPVWCEEMTDVSVANGDFSVALGSGSDPQGPEGYDPTCTTPTPGDLSLDPALVSSVSSTTPVTISIQVYDGSAWETLTPALPVSSSAFALQADTAQTAASATTASQLQGVAVSSTTPTDGQVLEYNSAASQWAPASSSAGTPGGSNGQVQFNNAGSFGASANLSWDATNFRLGIGAIAPAAQLDVSGFGANANGTLRVYDQSASGVTQSLIRAGASQSTTNLTTWENSSGIAQASMSPSGGLTANSLTLTQGSGSLVLQEATGGASPITWKLPIANASGYLENDGLGNLSWGSVSSGTVTSVTATAPLSSSGGTAPAISIANGTGAGDILYWSGAAWSAGLLSQDGSLNGSGALTVSGLQGHAVSSTAPSNNNVLYWNNGASQWQNASIATILGYTPANGASYLPLAGGTMTGALVNNTNSTSTALTVTQAGSGYTATFTGGDVGIGTTSPGALLDLGLAGTTLGAMRLEGSTSGYMQIQPSAAAGSWTMTLPADAPTTNGSVLSSTTDGVTSWVASGGSPALSSLIAATTNNTINNAAEAQTWDWTLTGNTTGMSFSENTKSTGGTSSGQTLVGISTLANSTADPFAVSAQGSTAFAVGNDGAVAIGTAYPPSSENNELEIQGQASASSLGGYQTVFLREGTSGVQALSIGLENGGSQYAWLQSVNVGQTTAEPLVLNGSGGNVGIGTTAPAETLSVKSTNSTGASYITSTSAGAYTLGLENTNNTGGADVTFFDSGANLMGAVGFSNPDAAALASDVFFGSTGSNNVAIITQDLARITVLGGNGNVGIGTTSPQTALQVAGVISPATDNTYTLGSSSYRFTNIYATGSVISTSDGRLKTDIRGSDLGLDFINKLRPVSYQWKSGEDHDVHYGLIAQETEKTVREFHKERQNENTPIVDHDAKTDKYGLKYTELISPMIKAVQELYHRLTRNEAKTAANARDIASIKTEVEKLKQENTELKARLERIEKNTQLKN